MKAGVRRLQPEDREAWEVLWEQYNAFYGRSGESGLSSQIIDTTWQRLLMPDCRIYGFIALQQGAQVGLAHIVFHDSLIKLQQTCYLQDLFVDHKWRGQRIGLDLMTAAQSFCKTRGVRDMYWHTHQSNMAARSLYNSVADDTGFVVYRQQFDN